MFYRYRFSQDYHLLQLCNSRIESKRFARVRRNGRLMSAAPSYSNQNIYADLSDGGRASRIPLNDGNSIPHLGLGTFLGFDEKGPVHPQEQVVSDAVENALKAGYRLVDTAALYMDEDQVGDGVRACIEKGIVRREDVFINTKLSRYDHRRVIDGLKESLQRLKMDYVDLYLIHFPMAFTKDNKIDAYDYLETWKDMERAQQMGLAKSIGLSNFNKSQIIRVLDNCKIKPAVLQIEVNLNLAQNDLYEFTKRENITVMAYTPFGSLFDNRPEAGGKETPPPKVDDPTLLVIATKYNKTTPQIVLRYLVQRGLVPIPKSVNKSRIEQNIDVFDFVLDEEEMKILADFNMDYRIVWPTFWQHHPYFPFEKKDVPDKNLFE